MPNNSMHYLSAALRKLSIPLWLFACLASWTSASAAPPATSSPGARFESRVAQYMDQAEKKPAFRTTPITVILEGDLNKVAAGLIKNLGGTVRFSTPSGHELSIPAGKLQALRNSLPDASLLRLPYPHAAAQVTSQGVNLTGALDMRRLSATAAPASLSASLILVSPASRQPRPRASSPPTLP